MCEKKISFPDVVVSGFLSLLFFGFFCVLAFILLNSLKNTPDPSKHKLGWLPEEYSRIEKKFTLEDGQIRYIFHQGGATVHWSFPFKSAIGDWSVHEVKTWHLSQNYLIVKYGVDYWGFGIIFIIMVVFGVVVPFFVLRCLSQLKEWRLKKGRLLENQGAV